MLQSERGLTADWLVSVRYAHVSVAVKSPPFRGKPLATYERESATTGREVHDQVSRAVGILINTISGSLQDERRVTADWLARSVTRSVFAA